MPDVPQVEAEAAQLTEVLSALAPYAELLPVLRTRHEELSAQADEAQHLMRDIEVSKMQVQLAAQLHLTADSQPGETLSRAGDSSLANGGGSHSDAGPDTHLAISTSNGSASGKEGASEPLSTVFTRLRELETQALELGSQNDDLKSLNAELQVQLQASADALSKMRHVAAAMGSIRGALA